MNGDLQDSRLKAFRLVRWLSWGLVAAVSAAFLLNGGYSYFTSLPKQTRALAPASIGGPFQLTDTDGRRFTERDLAGKASVIFFGFTNCPDVCPTTLIDIGRWLAAIEGDADKLNVLFITVDPKRDTPQHMKEYLSSFDPRIRGLTGTAGEIAAVAKAYGVFYKEMPLKGGGYTMDHSSAVYLMDPDGRFVEPVSSQTNDETAIKRLRSLAKL